jgi:hypothetical protein
MLLVASRSMTLTSAPTHQWFGPSWHAAFLKTHNLQSLDLNGVVRTVAGRYENGRVRVCFPPPIGLKSLKPQNLEPEFTMTELEQNETIFFQKITMRYFRAKQTVNEPEYAVGNAGSLEKFRISGGDFVIVEDDHSDETYEKYMEKHPL